MSVCGCSGGDAGWLVRFDPTPTLADELAIELIAVNHTVWVGILDKAEEQGRLLAWPDAVKLFRPAFKCGAGGSPAEEDWRDAKLLAQVVERANEAAAIDAAALPTDREGSKRKRL